MLLDTTKKSGVGTWVQTESTRDLAVMTRKMRENMISQRLEQAAREVGMYREAIEQKRYEKEALT